MFNLNSSPISKAFFTRHGVLEPLTHSRADLRISKDSLIFNHVLTVEYDSFCLMASLFARRLINCSHSYVSFDIILCVISSARKLYYSIRWAIIKNAQNYISYNCAKIKIAWNTFFSGWAKIKRTKIKQARNLGKVRYTLFR